MKKMSFHVAQILTCGMAYYIKDMENFWLSKYLNEQVSVFEKFLLLAKHLGSQKIHQLCSSHISRFLFHDLIH